MAAGLGFKTFTTGEVLTAGDTNGYLLQGILVFATEAARNAAITVPAEGQFAFTKDTNSTWFYDGAAWVLSGATGDVTGITVSNGIAGTSLTGPVPALTLATTAKGDLLAGTGSNTAQALTVGANATVLTADSTTATGLKWAAAGGGITLISNTTASALDALSLSSIPATYKNLVLTWNAYVSGNTRFATRFNNDSGTNYLGYGTSIEDAIPSSTRSSGADFAEIFYLCEFINKAQSASTPSIGVLTIYNYSSSTLYKDYTFASTQYNSTDAKITTSFVNGTYKSTTAISSINFYREFGSGLLYTDTNKSIRLYGVS